MLETSKRQHSFFHTQNDKKGKERSLTTISIVGSWETSVEGMEKGEETVETYGAK